LKAGEVWRARKGSDPYSHPGMQRIEIRTFMGHENWYIECEDGQWEIWTSSYIYENYERDYSDPAN